MLKQRLDGVRQGFVEAGSHYVALIADGERFYTNPTEDLPVEFVVLVEAHEDFLRELLEKDECQTFLSCAWRPGDSEAVIIVAPFEPVPDFEIKPLKLPFPGEEEAY
jgi:hypothetical protein